MRVPLPGFGALGCGARLGTDLGVRPHASQAQPAHMSYPSGASATAPGRVGQPFSHLCPSCQSQCGFFCTCLVVWLLFSYSSPGYSGRLFYNLVVIPVWSWERASVAPTYSTTILDPLKIFLIPFQNLTLYEAKKLLKVVSSCPYLCIFGGKKVCLINDVLSILTSFTLPGISCLTIENSFSMSKKYKGP